MTLDVWRPHGTTVNGKDYDKFISVSVLEVTETEIKKLPPEISATYWHAVVCGETDGIHFLSKNDLSNYYGQTVCSEIAEWFGPKAKNALNEYEDPLMWWEDYFIHYRKLKPTHGIIENPQEPVDVNSAIIKRVDETTLPIIQETYDLQIGKSNRSSSEEGSLDERRSLFLS